MIGLEIAAQLNKNTLSISLIIININHNNNFSNYFI